MKYKRFSRQSFMNIYQKDYSVLLFTLIQYDAYKPFYILVISTNGLMGHFSTNEKVPAVLVSSTSYITLSCTLNNCSIGWLAGCQLLNYKIIVKIFTTS